MNRDAENVEFFAESATPSRHGQRSPIAAGTLIGSGAILLWALWPSLVVWAQPLPTFQVLAGGFSAAFACFAGQRLISRRPVSAMFLMPKGMFVAGLFGILGTNVFFILGVREIGPGPTNVISYLWPILVMVIGALLAGARLTIRQVAGALLAFAGAILVMRPDGLASVNLAGVAFAFLSGASWAGYSLYRIRHAGGPRDAVGAFCGAAAVACTGLSLVTENPVTPSGTQALAIIGIGLAPMGFANLLWDYGMRQGDSRKLALLAYMTPLLGVLALWLTGAASPGWTVAFGAVFTVTGAFLGTSGKRRRGGKEPSRSVGAVRAGRSSKPTGRKRP